MWCEEGTRGRRNNKIIPILRLNDPMSGRKNGSEASLCGGRFHVLIAPMKEHGLPRTTISATCANMFRRVEGVGSLLLFKKSRTDCLSFLIYKNIKFPPKIGARELV